MRRLAPAARAGLIALAMCAGGCATDAADASGAPAAVEDGTFTVAVLPDTQFYTERHPDVFTAQTQWIAEAAADLDLRAVLHVGDITQGFGQFPAEWEVADAAMATLEAPRPGMPDGIPYGVAVGNHDLALDNGPSTVFNQWFGIDRFAGRAYYGGHYRDDNDNSYILFDGGGVAFLALFFRYEETDHGVYEWALDVIAQHPDRRVVIVSHHLLDTGFDAPLSPQGEILVAALGDHPRVDLLLAGHIPGEGQRTEVRGDRAFHVLLADYQERPNGGDGWLRLLRFDPAAAEILVETYSPTRDERELDADSLFALEWFR